MDMIEEYEERKRLRRSRFRWRVVAGVAVLAVIAMVIAKQKPKPGPHIARYSVEGVITDDRARDKVLKKIAENDSVEALILSIDSPGGSVVGSEILYESIRKVSEKKPVVAVMRNVAASGGYMAAIAADHLVARGNTITGSVGVIAQMPNAHQLLDRLGVSMLEVKSGPLKAQPSPFQPLEENVVDAKQAMVAESFDWFLNLVTERRSLSDSAVEQIIAGGVFTGRQAKELALIDGLGGEEEAVAWLESERDIASDRKVIDYGIAEKSRLQALLDIVGLAPNDTGILSSGLFAVYR